MELSATMMPSEVGPISTDWDLVPIHELLEKNTRITYGVVQPGKEDPDGVPFVRGGDVFDGSISENSLRTISKSVSDQYKRTKLLGGELLISLVGYPGECALVPDHLQGANVARQVALVRLQAQGAFDPVFVCHFLRSSLGKKLLLKEAFGSAQQVINLRDVNRLVLPLPRQQEEQHAIATALSDVDALIAGLERLIAKKRDIKQAVMQQLLTGQTRLPGFSGEWDRAELKHLVSTPITDGPHMTPTFYDVGVPFLSVNNLVDNCIDLTDLRYISKEDDLVFAKKCKPKVGDVLLGKAASVGKVAIVEEDFDFNIWSPIALVRAGDAINPKFLYYQLLSADCAGQIALLTNSSSQGNIGMGDIERLQISYPGPDEQTAIATVLSDMDADLSALESRLAKTRAIKQGMMQELLTGRTRLV